MFNAVTLLLQQIIQSQGRILAGAPVEICFQMIQMIITFVDAVPV